LPLFFLLPATRSYSLSLFANHFFHLNFLLSKHARTSFCVNTQKV
jgi:hypothetical protein